MTAHYPRIRLKGFFEGHQFSLLREHVTITFYLRRSHEEVVPGLTRALSTYLHFVGPESLAWYVDPEGDWRELGPKEWASIRDDWTDPRGAATELVGPPGEFTGYTFLYRGLRIDSAFATESGPVCMVSFAIPTELLEERGPEWVRELALKLAVELPFDSGHAGLSLQCPGWTTDNTALIRETLLRHPGMDIPDHYFDAYLGTRLKGVHWLTFLGPSVLEALGGVEGLRARVLSPDTTVQPVGDHRAVVTLGPWPEAGDLQAGRPLPAYRELARLLEPWLYVEQRCPWGNFTPEQQRLWERRFLD